MASSCRVMQTVHMWEFGIYVKNGSENAAKRNTFGQFYSFTLFSMFYSPICPFVYNRQGSCKQTTALSVVYILQITCALLHACGGLKRRNRWRMRKRKRGQRSGAGLLIKGLLTSLRALSSLGLLSSTLSLDCCFSFLSSAVTERHKWGNEGCANGAICHNLQI